MRVIALTSKAREHLQFFIANDRKLALKILTYLMLL